jgi:hypothetical protein
MVSETDYNMAHIEVEREKLKVMKQQLECLNAIGVAIENIDEKLAAVLRDKNIDLYDQ